METISLIIISVVGLIIALVITMKILSMRKGKILIILSNFNYSSGETVKGTVVLKLRKPLEAKGLRVGIIAESSSSNRISIGSSRPSNSKTSTVFSFSQSLNGNKLYPAGESSYDFSLKIPANAIPNLTGNQIADTLVKSAQILSGGFSSIRWYITAELEISGINLRKKVQINVG